MDEGFGKKQLNNLPKIDALMVAHYLSTNSDFVAAEMRGIKMQRGKVYMNVEDFSELEKMIQEDIEDEDTNSQQGTTEPSQHNDSETIKIKTEHGETYTKNAISEKTAEKHDETQENLLNDTRYPLICFICDYSCKEVDEIHQHDELQQHDQLHLGQQHFKCTMCDFNAKKPNALKKHKLLHYDRKPYTCQLCPYSTKFPTSLKKHNMTHTGEKPYACNLCEYSCAELGNLRKHQMVHSDLKPYVCTLCAFSCRLASDLTRHKLFCNNLFIQTNGNVFCPESFAEEKVKDRSKMAGKSKNYTTMKRKHSSNKQEETCENDEFNLADQIIKMEPVDNDDDQSYLFTENDHTSSGNQDKSDESQETLVLTKDEDIRKLLIKMEDDSEDPIKYTQTEIHHVMAFFPMKKDLISDMQYPFVCYICDFSCKSDEEFKQHKVVHRGQKLFPCTLCNSTCKKASDFKRHKMLHFNLKPYICDVCPYSTAVSTNLRKHKMTHTGEKPYACSTCSYSCSELGSLKKHQLIHSGEKPFVCNICDFSCRSSSDLTRHKTTHFDIKQYSCDECTYTCARLDTLRNHRFMHTGEKPFSCESCSFTCKSHGILINHRRRHTGLKPYGCEVCPFTCAQLTSFRRHMQNHTGDRPFACEFCTFACKRNENLKKHIALHTNKLKALQNEHPVQEEIAS